MTKLINLIPFNPMLYLNKKKNTKPKCKLKSRRYGVDQAYVGIFVQTLQFAGGHVQLIVGHFGGVEQLLSDELRVASVDALLSHVVDEQVVHWPMHLIRVAACRKAIVRILIFKISVSAFKTLYSGLIVFFIIKTPKQKTTKTRNPHYTYGIKLKQKRNRNLRLGLDLFQVIRGQSGIRGNSVNAMY